MKELQCKSMKKGIIYKILPDVCLYRCGEKITTIFRKEYSSQSKRVSKILETVNLQGGKIFPEITEQIYDGEKLVGYTISLPKGYKSLRQLARKKLALKKEICLKLEGAFDDLRVKKLYLADCDFDNIVINAQNDDIKFVRLERLSENGDTNNSMSKTLFVLTLSYLYNISASDIITLLNKNISLSFDNDLEIKRMYWDIKTGKVFNLDELLNLISKKDIGKRRSLRLTADNCNYPRGLYKK